jgi:putative redox protein
MTMTASAVSTAGELRNDIDVNRRHTIATDVPEGLGGSDTAPAPHELLPAMIASCVSTMISLYARARDRELEDVCVDVTYDSDATPRHAHVTVHLPARLTPDQVKRLTRVVDTCPVKRALEAGFTFDRQLVLQSRAPATAQAEMAA